MAKILEARAVITGQDRTGAAFARVAGKLGMLDSKLKAVARSQRAVGMVGGGVFTIMAKFATAGAIYEGVKESAKRFMALEKTMTELGITAGATQAQVDAATNSLSRQGPPLGETGQELGDVAKALVAAGMAFGDAVQAAPDIGKTAKAESADMNDIAQAANASMQVLGVSVGDLGMALDKMATGSKVGAFELKDMAREFPAVAASAQRLGFAGVDGVERLTAMLEITRKTAGDGAQAATNLRQAFDKVFSPTVQRAFQSKFKINLVKVLDDAGKVGKNKFEAVLDTVEQLTRGKSESMKQTIVGQLFNDEQARNGILALMRYRQEYEDFRGRIHTAQGTVSADLARILGTSSGKWDQAMASADRVMVLLGGQMAPAIKGIADEVTQIVEGFDHVKVSIDAAIPSVQNFLEKMGVSAKVAKVIADLLDADPAKAGGKAAEFFLPKRADRDRLAQQGPSPAAESISLFDRFMAETGRMLGRADAADERKRVEAARPTVAPAAPVAGKAAAAGAPVFGGRDAAIDAAIASAIAKRDQYRGLALEAAQQALMSGVIRRAVQEQKAREFRRSAEEYGDHARGFGLERAARGPQAPRDRMSDRPAEPIKVTVDPVKLDPASKAMVDVRIKVEGAGQVTSMSATGAGNIQARVGVSMAGARGPAPGGPGTAR